MLKITVALGVLVAIAFVVDRSFQLRGGVTVDRNAAAEATLQSLRTQLKIYQSLTGTLPTTEQGLQALAVKPASSPTPEGWIQLLDKVPPDPWNHPFVYRVSSTSDSETVDLFSLGPDGVESADDIRLRP